MSGRDFVRGLREAEEQIQKREVPAAMERRLRARFEGEKPARPWAWALGLGTLAAAGVALLIALSVQPERPAVPRVVNGFALAGAAGEVKAAPDGSVVASEGPVALVDREGRIEIAAAAGARLRREPDALRVLEGEVTLHVLPREGDEPPARVRVSHGAIEVLGTRFTVRQAEGAGQVTLHEGSIRYLSDDGREVLLVPGQSLAWPLPPARTALNAPAPAPVAPPEEVAPPASPEDAPVANAVPAPRRVERRPRAEAPALDVAALIEELNVLRRRGKFAEAAGRLEGALAKPLPQATRERLSYELGSILTWQLRDKERACAVWSGHRTAWPSGRYATEVERARRALGCP